MRLRALTGKKRSPLFGAPAPAPFDPNNFPNFASALTGGTYPITVNWVLEGDSLSAVPPGAPATWAPFLGQMLGTQIAVNNQAAGGRTLATMIARAAANIDTLIVRTPGVLNLLTYQGGINDIVVNQGSPGTTTTATLQAAYQTYAQARVAAGWDRVIPISVEASIIWNNATYGNVDYATVANWIRANILTWVPAFVDIPADSVLGPAGSYTNLSYYLDNTHKTVNGDSRKARQLIYPVLQAALAPTDRAAGSAVYGVYPPNGPTGSTTAVGVRVTNLPPVSGHAVTVTIGGKVCTSVTWDPTLSTVYCTVPIGSSSGDVVVTVDGVTARGGTGLWTANPVVIVDSIQPNVFLATGGPATIHANALGAGFSAGMTPTFADPVLGVVSATSVVIVSSLVMTCVVPALTPTSAGTPLVNLEVGGSINSAATQIGVLPSPVISALVPCSDLYSGGTLTLIEGGHTLTQPTSSARPTLIASTFGPGQVLHHVASSNQTLGNTLYPASTAAPYSVFAVAKIPSTSTTQGIFAGNSSAGGLVTVASAKVWWLTGGTAVEDNAAAASYPGNLFVAVINGASSKLYIDGVDTGATVAGTPGAFGTGFATGFYGGNYGNVDLGPSGLANAALTTQQIADIHWLFQQQSGTP